MILGGKNKNYETIDEYFKYLLYDIMGHDTFYRFMIDFKQVMFHSFLFDCLCAILKC